MSSKQTYLCIEDVQKKNGALTGATRHESGLCLQANVTSQTNFCDI